ncbi:outer membrane beta-barrel protein [Pedobacter sp. Hv1]|uniref:outer membrane beta-barrel protein n=1 Tax=Pedobacter sp. Hv1 TaxID=1740090 RepID=UPI0006D89E0E|nr:outer membrane beta-barrel protein [Pedobacter sp. Hv1]KQB99514.1 hypothetical protein AQF98_18315 [Pedobacter sp. Hv1]
MKDLNDKDFDQVFKKRMTETYPDFEEESWLKMEKKLRKRDRLVFYRNASIILLFLSFGLGFYFINAKRQEKDQTQFVKKDNQPQKKVENPALKTPEPTQPTAQVATTKTTKTEGFFAHPIVKQNEVKAKTPLFESVDSSKNTIVPSVKTTEFIAAIPQSEPEKPVENAMVKPTTPNTITTAIDEKPVKATRVKHKIPISLAISAGPDFNSAAALLGGKTSVAVGVSVGVGLSKRLGVQTGLIYGSKNYSASGYDYTFNNPNTQSIIASIEALCKVLEIPLKATYNLTENQNRSIEVNAGLSSYIMLRENYVFKYQPSLNRQDRTNEVINANQHFFSVLDLSATYNIKLKSKKLALGFEPYIKIPLSGIGEGNVPLKSSGVSLKLRYDLNKK